MYGMSPPQVTAVMLGLTGLVGVGPVRGVVCRGVASTGEHSEMMLALTCLVTDTADKVSEGWGRGGVLN